MIMMKLLLFMCMALSLGAIGACSSDNNDKDALSLKKLIGVWELSQFAKGWAEVTTFEPKEVSCSISDDDVIEVKNKTDVDLSPFVNNGTYSYHLDSSNRIIINGIMFEYSIEDEVLHLAKNNFADGECYVFIKNNE